MCIHTVLWESYISTPIVAKKVLEPASQQKKHGKTPKVYTQPLLEESGVLHSQSLPPLMKEFASSSFKTLPRSKTSCRNHIFVSHSCFKEDVRSCQGHKGETAWLQLKTLQLKKYTFFTISRGRDQCGGICIYSSAIDKRST